MMAKQFSSLAELRAEKQALKQQMKSDMENLKMDVRSCFMPQGKPFMRSLNKYLKYIGYAITIYKTANTVRRFFRKR